MIHKRFLAFVSVRNVEKFACAGRQESWNSVGRLEFSGNFSSNEVTGAMAREGELRDRTGMGFFFPSYCFLSIWSGVSFSHAPLVYLLGTVCIIR